MLSLQLNDYYEIVKGNFPKGLLKIHFFE